MVGIPDTDDQIVALWALAWDIVKEAHGNELGNMPAADAIKTATNDVLRIYLALVSQKPIP